MLSDIYNQNIISIFILLGTTQINKALCYLIITANTLLYSKAVEYYI